MRSLSRCRRALIVAEVQYGLELWILSTDEKYRRCPNCHKWILRDFRSPKDEKGIFAHYVECIWKPVVESDDREFKYWRERRRSSPI